MARSFLSLVSRRTPEPRGDHDAAFMARYDALRAYAARLAGADTSLREDLIQDAYVQFTTARPDLSQIRDLAAYLATVVRNLHVSSIRRAITHRTRHVAFEDYDSAMLALDDSSPEEQLRARDALSRICDFTSTRKDSSKAASAFALRFFHEVPPSDIARLLRTTPATVHTWLSQMRREVREFLADAPRGSSIAHRARVPLLPLVPPSADPAEALTRLRRALFTTSRPPCLSDATLAHWDRADRTGVLDVATCAHLVSCERCLNRVCAGLERSSDAGPRPPGDDDGGVAPTSMSGGTRRFREEARRRVRALREHRPQQLEISINGHHVGVLRVASSHNEVSWAVRTDEPVAFAELHSEQGVRMALLDVDLPPAGALIQDVRVVLSDARTLRLTLDFSDLHPVVGVEYRDPSWHPTVLEERAGDDVETPAPTSAPARPGAMARQSWWRRLWGPWSTSWRLLPVMVSSLLLAAALWWTHRPVPAEPGVPALVAQAMAREATAITASTAVRRTLRVHVRRADAATPTSTHTVEAWTRGDTRARAVRVFDRTGHLVAGRWQADGRETAIELGVFDDIWTADLSAGAFRERYLSLGRCERRAEPETYTLSCERPFDASWLDAVLTPVHAQAAAVPVRAALVLRRPDLHAIRLTVTVATNDVAHVVTVEEQAFTRVPLCDIPADAFVAATPRASSPTTAWPATASVPRPVTPSLEVRLLDVVDRLGAGDHLTVRRTGPDAVSVTGLVGTGRQKQAVLRALSELDGSGAITTNIQTFDEASRSGRRRNTRTEVRLLESSVGSAPIEVHLRSRLGDAADATAAIRDMSPRVLALAERLRRHAHLLETLAGRFDEQAVAAFDADGARAWQALVDRHGAAAADAIDALDALLAPFFEHDHATPPAPAPASLLAASRRLANEATTVHETLVRAFTTSTAPSAADAATSALDVRHHLHRARLDARTIRGDRPR